MSNDPASILDAELARCEEELRKYRAELNRVLGSNPPDMSAVEEIARKMRALAAHLETITRSIASGLRPKP